MNNSHQRNWSGIYTDESKQANVSASAISARSDMKSFNREEMKTKKSSLMFKKHFSDMKTKTKKTGSRLVISI